MKRHWIAGLFSPASYFPVLHPESSKSSHPGETIFSAQRFLWRRLTKKDALFNTIVGGAEIDGVPLREPSESTLVDV